ncbi:MAG TPA: hypothetical protein VI792_03730 [Candidatus Eisenbacteria bacterium]
MKHLAGVAWIASIVAFAIPADASVPVTFGKHIQRLQHVVDQRYGRGHIDVRRDYEGARAGDPDPWFWVGNIVAARMIANTPGCGGGGNVGWYEENGHLPAFPGGGVVFAARARKGDEAYIPLARTLKFGFYFVPPASGDDDGAAPALLSFTNRTYNAPAPGSPGDLPLEGRGPMRALIYDVSPWSQPHTWLVCFTVPATDDDGPGGDAALGAGDDSGENGDDQEGSDLSLDGPVFEVTGLDPTPARASSLGALKARYRH